MLIENIVDVFNLFPYGILSGIIMSIVCPFIGVFVVCRKDSFITLTLSEVSIMGVALAFFLNASHYEISIPLTIIASLFILRLSNKKIPTHSIFAGIFILASALAVLIVSKSAHGLNEVKNLFYGDLTLINITDFMILLTFLSLVFFFFLFFFRNFLYTFLDRDYAFISGIFVEYWEFCYMFAIGIIVSVTSFTGGILLSFCLLVISPSLGLLICRKIEYVILISVFISIISILLGFVISYRLDLPVNQTICAILCSLLIILSLSFRK